MKTLTLAVKRERVKGQKEKEKEKKEREKEGFLGSEFYASRISSSRGIFTINPVSCCRQIENRNLTSVKRKQVSSFTSHFNGQTF